MFNPYYNNYPYQQMPSVQPNQPSYISPVTLPGAVVNDISTIGADMVPMTGKPSVFPLMDGSAVYLKMWNNQGTISTVKYIPETQSKPVDPNTTDLSVLLNNFNDLASRVSALERGLGLNGGGHNE